MKKGLNREIIIGSAVELVIERGYVSLGMRELASRLSVKPSSLYNHILGIEDVQLSVAEYAGDRLERALREATFGKRREEALRRGVVCYIDFAKEYFELYKALIYMPKRDDGRCMEVGRKTFSVFNEILHGFNIDENNCLHLLRMLRAFLHGFLELCENGFMAHGGQSREESFKFSIEAFVEYLLALEERREEEGGESE